VHFGKLALRALKVSPRRCPVHQEKTFDPQSVTMVDIRLSTVKTESTGGSEFSVRGVEIEKCGALRERKDDILMLVEYFVQRHAKKAGKTIRTIEKSTLERLRAYDWPGKIRTLQNVIERSVILTSGDVFAVDDVWLSKESSPVTSRVAAGALGARAADRARDH
jgi:hypothetical protein